MSNVPSLTKDSLVDFLEYCKRLGKREGVKLADLNSPYLAEWYLREKGVA